MTTGSVDLVRELRERTGAGIMDCKAALQTSNGDIEKAIDFLRKKGVAQAAKRAGREAKEGLIGARIDGKKAALIEVNCETDFVARTDDFKNLLNLSLDEVMANGETAIESEKVTQRLAELSGKIGEKMLVRRARLIQSDKGFIFNYIHSNQKIGVVLELLTSKPASANALEELGKNIAMQIAASNPICIQRTEVPQDVIEREKEIFKEEVKGKPANIVDKIIQGKLDKFFQANCLLEQPFIKDDKISVQELLNQTSKTLNDTVKIGQFTRYQVGEVKA